MTSLKRKIEETGSAIGTMAFEFFVPGLPAIVAATGADFLLLDMEHSGAGFETMKAQCAACRGIGLAPIVRVPAPDYHFVARAFDVGAHGVMLPMIETAEQAAHIAACASYPPVGRRGAAFSVAHDDYRAGSPVDKMAAAAERRLVIAQIETPLGVENARAIAATTGIDVVWVGHFDLTSFMGIPAQFEHPDYRAAIDRVLEAARAAAKPAGFMATDADWAARYWDLGFRVIAYGLDHLLYQQALRAGVDLLRTRATAG
ncbi:HpcH/HpaI aldolase family protein [Salinarimonas rosea]|uniref:HpcH/HpaI aldolase family protein n=1 Tax=Salinarimonas rosea TaxID=552063 RepID=UPI00040FF400|nr:aldolase/citrate lyase family protein [Salinarimonas rosea]